MAEVRWTRVAEIVHAMMVALRSGDTSAFRDAVSDLELTIAVRRATGIGDPPTVPASEPVREEISELIDLLNIVDGTSEQRGDAWPF